MPSVYDLVVENNAGDVIVLPPPNNFTWSEQDLDGPYSGRNLSGVMFRDRVSQKNKLQCSWEWLAGNKVYKILNAVTDEKFKVTFWNPRYREPRQMWCYVGDRTATVKLLSENLEAYEKVSVNFIEY